MSLDSVFMTCNVAPNFEQYFLKWVIHWAMIYRQPDELDDIIVQAGFSPPRLLKEPMRIHYVVVLRLGTVAVTAEFAG